MVGKREKKPFKDAWDIGRKVKAVIPKKLILKKELTLNLTKGTAAANNKVFVESQKSRIRPSSPLFSFPTGAL